MLDTANLKEKKILFILIDGISDISHKSLHKKTAL